MIGLTMNRLRILAHQVRHPGKLVAYAGLRAAYHLRLGRVPFQPVTLDLEPNNDCNLKCPHCQVTWWAKARKHLDLEQFVRIIDQMPRLARIKLQGMGEPLLNKELLAMLRAGEARGISMQFTSNGTLLSEQVARELLQLKDTRLFVSIDGATDETFEAIRAGSRFAKIRRNLERLMAMRGEKGGLEVSAWTLLTKQNLHELPDIVRRVHGLGVRYMTVQTSITDWGKAEMAGRSGAARLEDLEAARAQITRARAVAKQLGVEIQVHEADHFSRERPCHWPWTSAYIASNGDVVPCCILADADTMRMGNVLEQPFSRIWNGAAYRSLRRRLGRHDLPEACRGCYGRSESIPSHSV